MLLIKSTRIGNKCRVSITNIPLKKLIKKPIFIIPCVLILPLPFLMKQKPPSKIKKDKKHYKINTIYKKNNKKIIKK